MNKNIKLLIIVIIFVVILTLEKYKYDLVYKFFQNNIYQPKYNNSNKIAILLTCTVKINNNIKYLSQKDKDVRINQYLKSIKDWLYNTNFNIIVVDNSNYNFDELSEFKKIFKSRLEIISFDEKNVTNYNEIINSDSKGDHELLAINYAYQNSNLIKKSDFIIKITGRYYIPEFQNFINSIDIYKYDYITQNSLEPSCEILGTSNKKFKELFNLSNKKEISFIELEYKNRIYSNNKNNNILVIPLFKIEPTIQGGSGNIKCYI